MTGKEFFSTSSPFRHTIHTTAEFFQPTTKWLHILESVLDIFANDWFTAAFVWESRLIQLSTMGITNFITASLETLLNILPAGWPNLLSFPTERIPVPSSKPIYWCFSDWSKYTAHSEPHLLQGCFAGLQFSSQRGVLAVVVPSLFRFRYGDSYSCQEDKECSSQILQTQTQLLHTGTSLKWPHLPSPTILSKPPCRRNVPTGQREVSWSSERVLHWTLTYPTAFFIYRALINSHFSQPMIQHTRRSYANCLSAGTPMPCKRSYCPTDADGVSPTAANRNRLVPAITAWSLNDLARASSCPDRKQSQKLLKLANRKVMKGRRYKSLEPMLLKMKSHKGVKVCQLDISEATSNKRW